MKYEDELERSRARRTRSKNRSGESRRRTNEEANRLSSLVEPGSRAASRRPASGAGTKHHRRRKPDRKKKIAIGIAIAAVAVIAAVLLAGYLYLKGKFASSDVNEFDKEDVQNTNISIDQINKMEKGYWTVAVFGVDSRDGSTGKGNQSDVIMIVNINRETGEIKLASVFRDSYLNINDKNTYSKINAAYAQGGPEQAVKALNKNLDLNITNYATFNWKAVATAINILGGVDIDISKSEFYYINAFITETVKGTGIGSTQLKSAGTNHLDGVQAVAYGRLRLMDTDYARTERQRLVIQKAFEKAKKADLATLNSLVGNMFAMCATNVDIDDILALVPKVTKYHLGETIGFPMARGEQKIKGQDMVIPQTLVSNVTSLHKFLFDEDDYTPSSAVQTISNKIAEISGLTKAGKEIDHVATDQGYVPKSTTAAASETTKSADDENEESSSAEIETDENGDPIETSEAQTDENGDPVETSTAAADGTGAASTTEAAAATTAAHATSGPSSETTSAYRETNEEGGPKSPADVIRETTSSFGPGHSATTETSAASPASQTTAAAVTTPTTAAASIISVTPTTAETTSGGPSAQEAN